MKLQRNPEERYSIEKLADEIREEFDLGIGPVSDLLTKLMARLGISIIYFPSDSGKSDDAPSAIYPGSKEDSGSTMSLIRLCLMNQIFSIAHGLYHHFERTGDSIYAADRKR